jgi:hypothetical protein
MKAPIQIALATVILALLHETADAITWDECDYSRSKWCAGIAGKELCVSCLAQGGGGYCYSTQW